MKFLLVLVALVVFLAACAAPVERPLPPRPRPSDCDRTFTVSSAFSEKEKDAIERAALRWNAIAVEQLCVEKGNEAFDQTNAPPRGIFRIERNGEYWRSLSESHGGANILGVHFGDSDVIAIIDTLSDADFELVALHEFGHALRLGHVPAPAIMHASIGTATDFTPNDLAECQRVGSCLKEDEDG